EVLTGAVDVSYPLLPDEARQVETQSRSRLIAYAGRAFLYIGWNGEREPFRDPRVRRALTLAIDRPAIIEALMYGFAQSAAGMIPPYSPVAPDITPLPYDPEAARQLLAEAGWTPGPDGIL